MRLLKSIGRWLWRFMVIFSFIVNLVLVVVLLVLGLMIFEIKNNIADPLVGGLHSTAVGLKNATIDWTIPVRDNLQVTFDLPLQQATTVTLNAPVPLVVSAKIDLPGINAYGVDANVNLTLPQGLQLPVNLDLTVPVDQTVPVALDVRAVIPLSETQLADPIDTLRLLFEPLAVGLHNLPSDFNQAGDMVARILRGELALSDINLLAQDGTGGINPDSYNAWAGYSRTAGLNYTLFDQPVPLANQPMETNIVPPGGIPVLDEQLPGRAALYVDDNTPATINAMAIENLTTQGIDPVYYDGTMAAYYTAVQMGVSSGNNGTIVTDPSSAANPPDVGGAAEQSASGTDDFGILPTPTSP